MRKIIDLDGFNNYKDINLALKILATKGYTFEIKGKKDKVVTLNGIKNIKILDENYLIKNDEETLLFLSKSSALDSEEFLKISNFVNLFHKKIFVFLINNYDENYIKELEKDYTNKFQNFLNKKEISFGIFENDQILNNERTILMNDFFQSNFDVIFIKENDYNFIKNICISFLPFVNKKPKKNIVAKIFAYQDFDKTNFNLETIFSDKYIYINKTTNIIELDDNLNINSYIKYLEDLLTNFEKVDQK